MLFMAAFPRQAKQIPLQIIYHHGEPFRYIPQLILSVVTTALNRTLIWTAYCFLICPSYWVSNRMPSSLLSSNYPNTLYKRLFAMGADSYQIAPMVKYLQTNPAESYPGDTGQMTIDNSGHIIRSMPWATFEQGNVMLLNAE